MQIPVHIRSKYILELDEQLLLGGVMLSEWTTVIVRSADEAFCTGADLATILTAVAAIECHLKHEYANGKDDRLVKLIDRAAIEPDLRTDLHKLRTYRNQWVHVDSPEEDRWLLEVPQVCDMELCDYAQLSIELLRKVLYHDQWV